ncbi:hypothetical protein GCM10010313_28890 [Streptomyces violarus]|uniref:DNA invertase Pin-like site-specific DNA recombinase n=1 Tax=Streptomyces violarus TaxID=67380 RepID=A0A7W5F3U0_9ACTN|nr:recombinase family protein [Streptomyces violarus]MBB3079050.1 DNA invertase Pin-like site-specific DNA recombinase [Streptomyces violarus]GHD08512.1 hypothetical protein GCM10010313_28890 [Streptomyces violarus]
MKRLGRGCAELLAVPKNLRHHDIQLELLNDPLQGVYDPSGHGTVRLAFFAGMAESEREYIRRHRCQAGSRLCSRVSSVIRFSLHHPRVHLSGPSRAEP